MNNDTFKMEVTKQDKRDIDKTINILESLKDSLDGLKDEYNYCDAIDVAMLWLERMVKENKIV